MWTWTALDSETKLVVSHFVGDRSAESAMILMDDLRARLANRVQLNTHGHRAYLEAVEGAFGADVDFAQLVKLYGGADGTGPEKRYSPPNAPESASAASRATRTSAMSARRTWSG